MSRVVFNDPDPRLLRPHIFARHDLIPLNQPHAIRQGRKVGKAPRDHKWQNRDYTGQDPSAWMIEGNNVGVRLNEEQLVIDVDERNFAGADRLAELCSRFSLRLKDFPRVLTGAGGQHIYTAKPRDLRISEKIEGLPGIEFKTKGRQVVAAGSVHPETNLYYRADDPLGDLLEPPMAPEALLAAISKNTEPTPTTTTVELTSEQLDEMLSTLKPTDYRDYNKWLALMMASHQATRGEGVEEFAAWSMRDPKYASHADQVRAKWKTIAADRPRGVTVATLFKAVKDTGRADLVAKALRSEAKEDFEPFLTQGSRKPAATFANCLLVLERAKLDFAYDELARRPLVRAPALPWTTDIGRELNDDMLRIIRHFLIQSCGLEFSRENITEACLTLSRQAPFNPVTDYLNSLTWDGTERLANWLVRYLGADDNEYVRTVGRIALIAAVRRARQPGCKFDHVMIFEGRQGTGKSSALKIIGGEWHSDAELGRLDSKEAPLVLQSVWIHELGELTALSRSEVDHLKAFVSRWEDRFRAPYERTARTEPRRCIFIGTTNAEAYLLDTTGNRRFWPIKTNAIDLDALRKDRDQLWAEAAKAEAEGAAIELPQELWPIAAAEQATRSVDEPWKDAVERWLDHQGADRVHTRDILRFGLDIDPARQTQHVAKRLRETMRLVGGWTYKRSIRIEEQGIAAGYEREGVGLPPR